MEDRTIKELLEAYADGVAENYATSSIWQMVVYCIGMTIVICGMFVYYILQTWYQFLREIGKRITGNIRFRALKSKFRRRED